MESYRRLEDLKVYQKLCRLHIEVSGISHRWPPEEKYELPEHDRRWPSSSVQEDVEAYGCSRCGFPEP